MRLILPTEFLPCIDDAPKLRVMADYIEDFRDGWQAPDCPLDDAEREFLARLLWWTADEWTSGLYCRRGDVLDMGEYRLRWKSGGPVHNQDQGYRMVWIWRITEHRIEARKRVPYMHFSPQPEPVAWWDLTPYCAGERKPKRRSGFATHTNAMLANALAGSPTPFPEVPVIYQPQGELAEAPLPGGLFA